MDTGNSPDIVAAAAALGCFAAGALVFYYRRALIRTHVDAYSRTRRLGRAGHLLIPGWRASAPFAKGLILVIGIVSMIVGACLVVEAVVGTPAPKPLTPASTLPSPGEMHPLASAMSIGIALALWLLAGLALKNRTRFAARLAFFHYARMPSLETAETAPGPPAPRESAQRVSVWIVTAVAALGFLTGAFFIWEALS